MSSMKTKSDSRRCLLCQTRGDVATLFRFPQRLDLKKEWASFCNMDPNLLTHKDCLCINHFATDQVFPKLPNSKKTKLRRTAVPCYVNSIFNQRTNESIKSSIETVVCENSSQPDASPMRIDLASCNDNKPKPKKKRAAPPNLTLESVLGDTIDSEDKEVSSFLEYEEITVINLPSAPENSTARKSVRYIGDVTAEHLKSHEDAIKYFFMAKNALEKSRAKVKFLHRQVRSLKEQLNKYKDKSKQNGGHNTEDSISDDDFTWPLEDDPLMDSTQLGNEGAFIGGRCVMHE